MADKTGNVASYTAHSQEGILLNANECSLNCTQQLLEEILGEIRNMSLNRYPDDEAKALRRAYGALYGLDENWVLPGNGSDQMLQLLINAFHDGERPLLTLAPDFSMYDFYASCAGMPIERLESAWDGSYSWKELARRAVESNAALVLFSNPNNPTGYMLSSCDVKALADAIAPIPLAMDEAYMEFGMDSAIGLLEECPNLYVTRTLSKAWGLAGIRLGFVLSRPENIEALKAWKIVYSVSSLSQAAGLAALRHPERARAWADHVSAARDEMEKILAGYDWLQVIPSKANFICLLTPCADDLAAWLKEAGVQVRVFAGKGRVRITIGTSEENEHLLSLIAQADRLEAFHEKKQTAGILQAGLPEDTAEVRSEPEAEKRRRRACGNRTTKETSLEISVDLDGTEDGTPNTEIETGIGFFDHMLTLFGFHGGLDLRIKADGDLEVDDHHTIEDIGILLGKLFREALGDKKGIARYGNSRIVMDEALAVVDLDFSGRPYLVFDADFSRDQVGEYSTEMTEEFLRAFAFQAGLTLHVHVPYGKNDHHKVEAIFKALARAIRQAVKVQDGAVNSTKGVLE